MARLIDADKINYHEHTECMGHGDFETVRTVTDKEIAEIPTVDAVEVVRCRDCKWYMPGDLFTDVMFCHRLKKDNGKPAKYNYCADDFCSYGERKGGGGNG